jgi:hypothetical protein
MSVNISIGHGVRSPIRDEEALRFFEILVLTKHVFADWKVGKAIHKKLQDATEPSVVSAF